MKESAPHQIPAVEAAQRLTCTLREYTREAAAISLTLRWWFTRLRRCREATVRGGGALSSDDVSSEEGVMHLGESTVTSTLQGLL